MKIIIIKSDKMKVLALFMRANMHICTYICVYMRVYNIFKIYVMMFTQ